MGRVLDGDFVVVSEKALAVATGKIVDESYVEPSRNAQFIARFLDAHVSGGIRLGSSAVLGIGF